MLSALGNYSEKEETVKAIVVHPIVAGITCMEHILGTILAEIANVSTASPEQQQLLSSVPLQLLSAMALGVQAQWLHARSEGGSVAAGPAAAAAAHDQANSSDASTVQRPQAPAYHLLLWESLL